MLNLQWTEASSCSICSPLSPSGNSLSVILFIVGSIAPPVGWLVDDDSSPMEIIYFTCFLSRFMSNKNGFFFSRDFHFKKIYIRKQKCRRYCFSPSAFLFSKIYFSASTKRFNSVFSERRPDNFQPTEDGGRPFSLENAAVPRTTSATSVAAFFKSPFSWTTCWTRRNAFVFHVIFCASPSSAWNSLEQRKPPNKESNGVRGGFPPPFIRCFLINLLPPKVIVIVVSFYAYIFVNQRILRDRFLRFVRTPTAPTQTEPKTLWQWRGGGSWVKIKETINRFRHFVLAFLLVATGQVPPARVFRKEANVVDACILHHLLLLFPRSPQLYPCFTCFWLYCPINNCTHYILELPCFFNLFGFPPFPSFCVIVFLSKIFMVNFLFCRNAAWSAGSWDHCQTAGGGARGARPTSARAFGRRFDGKRFQEKAG